jgi:hypothetical protein
MIQSFQCPVCGNLNPLGKPSCPNCGQSFVYNCPVCGNPIDNRYLRCASCNTLFNWTKTIVQNAEARTQNIQPQMQNTDAGMQNTQQQTQNTRARMGGAQGTRTMYPESRQSRVEIDEVKEKPASSNVSLTSRPAFWLFLMLGCMILIALLLLIDRMINR